MRVASWASVWRTLMTISVPEFAKVLAPASAFWVDSSVGVPSTCSRSSLAMTSFATVRLPSSAT